jgi:hypothetical protein
MQSAILWPTQASQGFFLGGQMQRQQGFKRE